MNRVLVVDDEPGMRAALEAHFIRRNWRVDTAASAVEAMEKFRRGLHPLVVTDIRLGGADGFSVMGEARKLSPHTAVILLTAFGNVPDAVTAMKDGACDYWMTPTVHSRTGVSRYLPPILTNARWLMRKLPCTETTACATFHLRSGRNTFPQAAANFASNPWSGPMSASSGLICRTTCT